MESAPSIQEVLQQWVFDPLWLVLLAAIAFVYFRAFARSRGGRSPHPTWKGVFFGLGLLAAAVAVMSPVAHYARELLWVNFTSFLILTMIAPPLLLLGSPLTLAFRVSGPRGCRRLRSIYRSRPVVIATFPVASWLLFAVATYLWQFTDLTDWAAQHAALRAFQQVTLLVVGVIFWIPALALDPLRWRLGYPLRALYIFLEMTHKGLFGGMFLSMNTAMHSGFVSRLPAWGPDPLTDQRIAILILWIGGNLIFLVALAGLVVRWVSYEQRNQRRTDFRLEKQRQAAKKRRAALDQVFTKGV